MPVLIDHYHTGIQNYYHSRSDRVVKVFFFVFISVCFLDIPVCLFLCEHETLEPFEIPS